MKRFPLILVLIFVTINLYAAQIKVTSFASNPNNSIDKIIFGASETRSIFLINDNWKIYSEEKPSKKIAIKIPATFEGEEQLTFERKLELNQNQIDNFIVKLGFLGINYSAEIFINGNNIYNHTGGAVPFEIILPKDFLRSDKANIIKVKVNGKLDSESTIPTKQRFLFPEIGFGIIRDAYVKIVPKLSISQIDFNNYLNQQGTSGKISFDIKIENYLPKPKFGASNEFGISVNIFSPSFQQIAKNEFIHSLNSEEIYEAKFDVSVSNILPWSPESPNFYYCEINLTKDGRVVDKQVREISFFKLVKNDKSVLLNGNPFVLKGTTYLLNETESSKKDIYERIKNDLTFIKQTGFNAVRFSKSYPHPYAIKICQELGLFAVVEFPMNSIPENFLEESDYRLKIAGLEKDFISHYNDFANTIFFGIGSGFLPNSSITENFITKILNEIENKNVIAYASFVGPQTNIIDKLDFYGIEIFSSPVENINQKLSDCISKLGSGSVFISEVSYPNFKGVSTGYLVNNSLEAQAKYFEDVINLSQQLNLSGFFINTLLSYKGVYESLYASYSGEKILRFSVLSKYRNTNNAAYKVLYSKLNNGSKVAIPIGNRKDENQIEFILIALMLSIVLAILINTKRKFREDATRALLRSYNFFADIRDHRIMSGVHSSILMLIISGSFSLLFTILLYYYRSNYLLENILVSFASRRILSIVSFLAWNPKTAFVVIFFVVVVKIFLLSLIAKVASFFVKTKVPFLNIYFTIVWSFLPITLMLPVELVLYKILTMNVANILIIAFLILVILWLFFRMLKGIYVIFDVPAINVYLYSFLIVIVFVGGILLKYQVTHSIIFYLTNAFKQFSVMI